MVVRVIAVLGLVGLGELLGVAEPAVLQRGLGQPGRHAEGVVGVLAQRLAKVLTGHADGERIQLGRDRQALGVAHEVEDLRLVPGHQHGVHVLGLHLRQQRAEVAGVAAVALVHHQVEAGRLEQRPRAVRGGDVERIIGIQQRDGLGWVLQRLHHLDGAAEIVAGRRQRAEDVLEAARENLVGRAAALHHRDLVFLGHHRVGQLEVAGKAAQQQVHLVLRHQLRVLAHRQVHVRLVVVQLERQLVRLAIDLDAALGIDLVDGHLVGVAVVAPGVGHRPGQLHRGAEHDVLRPGRRGRRGGQHGREQGRKQKRVLELHGGRPLCRCLSSSPSALMAQRSGATSLLLCP